jgi:hypothetical protein
MIEPVIDGFIAPVNPLESAISASIPGRSLRVPDRGIDRPRENALKSDKNAFEKVAAIQLGTAAIPLGSWRTSFAGRRDEPSVIAWRYLQQG